MTYLILAHLADHIRELRRKLARDDGYSTETIAVVALLVALALTVIGIITVKVVAKANSINLGSGVAP